MAYGPESKPGAEHQRAFKFNAELYDTERRRKQFEQEASVLEGLEHQNIARFHNFHHSDGTTASCIEMAFINRKALGEVVRVPSPASGW